MNDVHHARHHNTNRNNNSTSYTFTGKRNLLLLLVANDSTNLDLSNDVLASLLTGVLVEVLMSSTTVNLSPHEVAPPHHTCREPFLLRYVECGASTCCSIYRKSWST